MNSHFIKIAEHTIRIITKQYHLSQSLLRSFETLSEDNMKPDITLTIMGSYGVPFKDFEVVITKDDSRISYYRADYHIEATKDYSEAVISVYNDLALKHALINFYSAYIVYHRWGLLIHSSCVVDQGNAHLFSGQSGAGKSTVAELSLPRKLMSDEASIVKISDEGVHVYNSPFRSDIKCTGKIPPSPLISIHLLIQSMLNRRERLEKMTALLKLIDKVFYWRHNATETNQIIELLKTLVNHVPVYDLYFQKNDTFWELIS